MRTLILSLLLCWHLGTMPAQASTVNDQRWRSIQVRFDGRNSPVQEFYISTRLAAPRANLLVAALVMQGPDTPFRYSFPSTWGLAYFEWLRPAGPAPLNAPTPAHVPLPTSVQLLLVALAGLRLASRNAGNRSGLGPCGEI